MTAEPLISFSAMMVGGLSLILLVSIIAEITVNIINKKAHQQAIKQANEQQNTTHIHYNTNKNYKKVN